MDLMFCLMWPLLPPHRCWLKSPLCSSILLLLPCIRDSVVLAGTLQGLRDAGSCCDGVDGMLYTWQWVETATQASSDQLQRTANTHVHQEATTKPGTS